ncbi:hypothetical protein SESBI_37923 [Sesbania bispinosa]|nr:hypothetical protein SESBI_37923 [Sesbania bispinosa]
MKRTLDLSPVASCSRVGVVWSIVARGLQNLREKRVCLRRRGDAVNEQQCESGEDLEGIHFDDSEEDRDLGLDDGFENQEVGVAEAALNEKIEIMKMKNVTNEEDNDIQFVRSSSDKRSKGGERVLLRGEGSSEVINMHQIDEEYSSEDLETDLDESDVDGVGRPKCTKYNREDIYYKREAYALCYGKTITPINGQALWPKTHNEVMLPPNFKVGPGRPKKLRRSHTTDKCRRCNNKGHNSRRCKLPPPPPEATEEENVVQSQSMASEAPTVQSQVAGGVQELVSNVTIVQPQEMHTAQKQNGRPKKTSKQPGGSQEPRRSKPQKRKITATETTAVETQRPSTSKKQKAKLVPRKAATGIQIVEPPIMPSPVPFFELVLAQVVHVSNLWVGESIGGTTVQGEVADVVARAAGLDTEQGSMSTTTTILEQDTIVGAGAFEPSTEVPPKKD